MQRSVGEAVGMTLLVRFCVNYRNKSIILGPFWIVWRTQDKFHLYTRLLSLHRLLPVQNGGEWWDRMQVI